MVIADFGDPGILKEKMYLWDRSGGLKYTMKTASTVDMIHDSLDAETVTHLTTALVRQGAFHNRVSSLACDEESLTGLVAMETCGFVTVDRTKEPWAARISERVKTQNLIMSFWQLHHPSPACSLQGADHHLDQAPP